MGRNKITDQTIINTTPTQQFKLCETDDSLTLFAFLNCSPDTIGFVYRAKSEDEIKTIRSIMTEFTDCQMTISDIEDFAPDVVNSLYNKETLKQLERSNPFTMCNWFRRRGILENYKVIADQTYVYPCNFGPLGRKLYNIDPSSPDFPDECKEKATRRQLADYHNKVRKNKTT